MVNKKKVEFCALGSLSPAPQIFPGATASQDVGAERPTGGHLPCVTVGGFCFCLFFFLFVSCVLFPPAFGTS